MQELHPQPHELFEPDRASKSKSKKFEFVFKFVSVALVKIDNSRTSKMSCVEIVFFSFYKLFFYSGKNVNFLPLKLFAICPWFVILILSGLYTAFI